jgi:hypothetical protein
MARDRRDALERRALACLRVKSKGGIMDKDKRIRLFTTFGTVLYFDVTSGDLPTKGICVRIDFTN